MSYMNMSYMSCYVNIPNTANIVDANIVDDDAFW